MKIGLVSPYSFDVPGGVQFHVLDLAKYLLTRGHEVSVLAPADEDTELPDYVVSAGRAVPVRYNGSVARLAFGPAVSNRVTSWVLEGNFDVIHIHEPANPSVSLLAIWAAKGPVVGTFHTSIEKSRALRAAEPILRPSLEKLSARIAVSEAARQTVADHLGDDTYVIPNGVYVGQFHDLPEEAERRRWRRGKDGPTVAFLGRFGEPRKGLHVLVQAAAAILTEFPDAQFLVAGPGDVQAAVRHIPDEVAAAFRFLGPISDEGKISLLADSDVYVAPNTGGESFGIILVEAMAAGAAVVASDLTAFEAVLGDGDAGLTFRNGSGEDLAAKICTVLRDPELKNRMSTAAAARAWRFDWSRVGEQIIAVYESVRSASAPHVVVEPPARTWSRWRRR